MRSAAARDIGARLLALTVAALIVAGSFVVWVGIPAGFIWVSSRTARTLVDALAIMLIACPLAMVAFAVVLVRLNAIYLRLSGAHPDRARAAWLRGLADGRRARAAPPVLEISMTLSAIVALVALFVWFFVFAHSSLPAAF